MVTLANRVKVTSATTGTADTVSLGSAITGFQTFSEASITDGAQVRYVIEDGANFEIGVGTFQSPATLVRSDAKVSESTSSNNKINLSGNAIVFITASAEDIPQLKVLSTQTIDNPNYYGTSASDEFGWSVAVSGNYTVVGAPKEDELLGGLPYDNTGRAYIFDTDSGSLLHTLQDDNNDISYFGTSVGVSGKYAIVGAPSANGFVEGQGSVSQAGQAYIFDVTTGSLTHTLDNPNAYGTGTIDNFGTSVAISGNYVIVGAKEEDDAGGVSSGKAYIFDTETGSLLHTLDNPNAYSTSGNDSFGNSVAISGIYAIASASGEDDAGGTFSGKAYIFNVTTGNLVHTLDNPTAFSTSEFDTFGISVAISGDRAIVGAYAEGDAGGIQSGKAYIFDVVSGNLLYTLDNPNAYGTSEGDLFGRSVDISGNYAIVGAYLEDDAGGTQSGKAYIYDISTFTASTVSSANYVLDNPNAYSTSAGDNFGASVAISGNRVVVGAYNEDDANGTTSGKLYSFKLSTEPYAYTADEISLLASSSGGSTDYINSASFNTGTGVLSLTGEGNAGASVDLDGRYQLAGTYNTVIGTDTDIDTSGATIIDNIYVTDGVITSMGTRTLTAGDIGAQPSGTYNTIIGTDTDIDTSGSTIIDNIYVTDGVITSMGTRTLTAGDIGALPSSVSNQNLNTTDSVTFAGLNINGILNAVDSIFLADNIYHEGDTNTYMQFHAEDQWRVVTGGTERLEVNNSYVTVQNDLIVNGGDIVLGGTGRIQGIDTVSSSTDAANKLYVDNAVAGAGGGGISNVVEDTTPQLGGTLDSNGNNIEVNGGGTFTVSGGGDVFIKEGVVNLLDLPSMGANAATLRGKDIILGDVFGVSGSLDIQSHGGTTGSLTVDGDVTLNGIVYPSADGTNGQVLTTDGSGNLSFTTSSGGGISNVVEDTTPQLGGNLDLNGKYIGHANANMQAYDFGTGSQFQVNMQGSTALSIYANMGSSIANVTINDDLTVQGGDITLGGTGRIQGIDTVSADTDAANKLYVDNAVAGAGGGGTELTVMSTKTLDNPTAYGTSAFDSFGNSVAISGNYAIVGAYNEDDASALNNGKAYIFNAIDGSLVHTLDNPNATSGNTQFGWSVAISGNYAIVGSYLGDTTAPGGQAHIFNVTDGSLVHTLNNPNAYGTSSGDYFGYSVGISGNYAIVGARREDDAGGTDSGKVYIFNVATGALVHTLNNPNAYSTSASDHFGWSVSVSENYAIVGAWGEDDAGGAQSGKAYIFNVATGTLVYTLNNPNAYSTSGDDQFGKSVAISGNYAIVGAYGEDDAGGTWSGKAYIYDISTFTNSTISSATYVLNNPTAYSTSGDDQFGEKVAISGNYAIVSADQEDAADGSASGKAYIYDISTFTTTTISSANYVLDNPNAYGTGTADTFSFSVAISGNYAIVGSLGEDDAGGDSSGKAYIFRTNGHPYSYSSSEIASFAPAGGGIAELVEDTTPQLGGNLDLNGYYIGPSTSFMRAFDYGTGSHFEIFMQGSRAFELYAAPGSPTANVKISHDLTVNGGDITLGGTGRIQGIDTVSADTDAANKLYVDNAVAGAGGGGGFAQSYMNNQVFN